MIEGRVSWIADTELQGLIQRYYQGEAGLWTAIRDHVDNELRRRGRTTGAHHIRLRLRADQQYEVLVDPAPGYEIES